MIAVPGAVMKNHHWRVWQEKFTFVVCGIVFVVAVVKFFA